MLVEFYRLRKFRLVKIGAFGKFFSLRNYCQYMLSVYITDWAQNASAFFVIRLHASVRSDMRQSPLDPTDQIRYSSVAKFPTESQGDLFEARINFVEG